MVKYLLNFLFVFLMLSSFSAAKNEDFDLQNEYGRDLTHAPFFLRFSYFREFNEDWKKTTYSQRREFLADYEASMAKEQAKERADAKTEAAEEKERLKENKEATREERNTLRARIAEEKAEERAEKEQQKEFNETVRTQERELQQMEREAAQGQ